MVEVRVKKMEVGVGPRRVNVENLLEVARKIDRGEDVKHEKVVFESYEAFRSVLTPERLRILHVIKEYKPGSIYELSKILGRDRRNLMKDLELLETVGLIEMVDVPGRRKRKTPVVSYDEIQVSIPV